MKTDMRLIVVLIILFVQTVKDDIINMSNRSDCLSDECTTAGIDLPNEISESVTAIDIQSDYSTEEQTKIENIGNMQQSGEEQKLKSTNGGLQDEFHAIKLPNPVLLLEPENKVNNSKSVNFLSKKEYNEELSADEKSEEESIYNSKTEKSAAETKPELKNKTSTNTTKDTHHKHNYQPKNQSEICTCDLKEKICDINCCCDRDCNANMKTVFTTCVNAIDEVSSQFCFKSKSIFKNNLEANPNYNGLLCIVRNSLHPHVQFMEEMIIDNVTKFNKMISRKKLFSYSPIQLHGPEMQEVPYIYGDYIWSVTDNKTIPFGVPKQTINMECKSKQNIHYLSDYETQCLRSIPYSEKECMTASELGMEYYIRNTQLIRSPALIKAANSSDEMCNNMTCVPITTYICSEDEDFASCVKSAPRRPVWDTTCKNIVVSVEYHIYHNGTDGIKEARTYFTLNTLRKESFIQKIKLKFLWVKTPSQVLKRSGNPGYITGKPIMSGRKVYSSNETMSLRKEAIELSYNPEDWLTVVGSIGGVCSLDMRRPIGFGENALHTCLIDFEEYDYLKSKCVDLQDGVFSLLLGDDFTRIKLDNNLNKFVATFGNSNVEDTGDWVQVIIDVLPLVSSQVTFTSYSDFVMCKNVISDLFIDVAYTKIGSFDRPQNKILGVYMHFGSPKDFIYYSNPNCRFSQNLKLSTYVHFIDLTREPVDEFAETPGFEAKLPHDFFYPFFSGSCKNFFNVFMIFFCLSVSFL